MLTNYPFVHLMDLLVCIVSAGGLKCFGLSVGQLTTPLTSAAESTLVTGTKVPSDNRETEAFYATAVGTTLSLWSVLQVMFCFPNESLSSVLSLSSIKMKI